MVFNKTTMNYISGSVVNSGDNVELSNTVLNGHLINIESNNNLPPAPYIDFIGREEEVLKIASIIECRNTYILSIEGIGGLGKTSIAHYVAKKLIDENKVGYVIWCSAKNKDINEHVEDIKQYFYDLETFLNISLKVLGFDNLNFSLEEKKEILKNEVANKGKEKTILFVLDNFETVKDQSLIDFIDSFMYSTGKHFFLFTSRIRSGLKDRPIEIGGLSEENLIKIAKSYVNKFGINNINDIDIIDLAKKAKGNPLVVRVCIVRMETRKPKEVIRVLDNPNGSKIYEDIANYLFLEIFNELSNEAKIILYILNYIGNQNNKSNKYSDFEIGILGEVMSDDLSDLGKDLKLIFDEINMSGLLHITFDISKNDSIDSIVYEEFLTIFLQKMKEEDIEIQKKLKNFQIQYETKRNTHSLENKKYEEDAKNLLSKSQNDIICYKECSKAITNLNKYHNHDEETRIFLDQAKSFIDIAETFSKDFGYLNYTKGYYYLKEGNFEKGKVYFSKLLDIFYEWKSESKILFFMKNYLELLVRNADNEEALAFILKYINILKSSNGTIKEQIRKTLRNLESSYRNQKNFEKEDEIKRILESI